MDIEARYTLVGAVVLVLFTGVLIFALWLMRGTNREDRITYAVHFQKQSLSGLQVDGPVTMRGIKVGTVKSVEIQPQDIERVRVVIAVDVKTPVRTDTRALISRNLLTGLAGIDLAGSTQDAHPLVQVPPGEQYPVIQEGQGSIEVVQENLPHLLANFSDIMEKTQAFLSDQNAKSFTDILSNAKSISEDFVAIDRKVSNAVELVDRAMRDVSDVLSEAKGTIKPALASFSDGVKALTKLVHTSSNSVASVSDSVAQTARKLRDPQTSILGPAEGNFGPGERKD